MGQRADLAREKPGRWSTWLAVTLALSVIGVPSTFAGQVHPHLHRHGIIEGVHDQTGRILHPRDLTTASTNWSGYVLPNFETGQKYTSASATWVVPSVILDPEDNDFGVIAEFSSSWLGIGGYFKSAKYTKVDTKLIQLGTEQDAFSDGPPQYYAWYEKLPSYAVLITTLQINPGDTITASLSCAGKCKGKASWTLTMTDETTTQTWSKTVKYNASKLSVDLIEEAPYGQEFAKQKLGVLPLADFGTTSFSSSIANDLPANLSTSDNIEMFDNSNYGKKFNYDWGQTSNVSSPNATFDGFNACWGSGGVLTSPCNPD